MSRDRVLATISFLILTSVIVTGGCGSGSSDRTSAGLSYGWPRVAGAYLGMEPPGREARLFAPGLLTRGFHEISMTFSPSLDEFCYITSDRAYSFYAIIHSRIEDGLWTAPDVVPFSGRFRDASVSFKPDGSGVLVSSDRPPADIFGLWEVGRAGGRWGTPVELGALIPGFTGGTCAVQTSGGDLFFQSMDNDIYVAALDNGTYLEPRRIPEPVSTGAHEGRPFVAPDGSYLIFNSNRPGGFGESDLYVSFATGDGWGEALNLGAGVNSTSGDFSASVSPDGRYIFFSSYRTYGPEKYEGMSYSELMENFSGPLNGYAALYWVDASILEALRADN